MAKGVLIVDDVPQMRKLLRAILTELNLICEEAGTGEQALEILKARPKDFGLVLLDLFLPAMNGFDVLKKIRENYPDQRLKICLVSGKRDKESVNAALEIGADDYVVKPIDMEIFKDKVKRLLGLQKKSVMDFARIKVDFKAKVPSIPIPLDLTIKELSEAMMVMESPVEFTKGAQIDLDIPELKALINADFVFNCRVLACKKDKDGIGIVHLEFFGLSENIAAKIRELTIKGKAIAS